MPGAIWMVTEGAGGHAARIDLEVATLTRHLGDASGRDVAGIVTAATKEQAESIARDLATYLPRVLALVAPELAGHPAAGPAATAIASLVAGESPAYVLTGASPDGRDVAGHLSAILGWGVLVNAMAVTWEDGPVVEMSIFGGRQLTTSTFTADHGIVTVRPNAVTAEASATPGSVDWPALPAVSEGTSSSLPPLATVVLRDHVAAEGTVASIEEARIIVAGGRGVGGSEGFALVREIADALGGAVGATRAAVDSGWIPYGQQIGQTGKTVKPALYLALGISGAIQHKVGMQTAETIVAVNRDADAPIAEFADLFVLGDLFDVGPAIVAALRERSG